MCNSGIIQQPAMQQVIRIRIEAVVFGRGGLVCPKELDSSSWRSQREISSIVGKKKVEDLKGISGYVRINVIHSLDIATPARVPS